MSEHTTVALVTGVSRAEGIGYAVCRQLAEHGMTVLLTARDLSKATALAVALGEEGHDVRPFALDVTDTASIGALVSALAADPGRLDVLVNNAAAIANWEETASGADIAAAQATLEANLFGPWRVTQALLPLLRQSPHGRVVMVSSGAGSHGEPQFGLATGGGVASYGISKAALNALTTKFAVELAGSSVLVNAVCPGLTATAPGMEAMGARPVAVGAASVGWAALLPDDGPSGGFFRDGQPLPW